MKYAITFLLLGSMVSYSAISLGGWWHALHWFSFSCFLLAAGYAGAGPRIFGKRPNGRIPIRYKIAHLPFMLYSQSVWHLVRILSREDPANKVSEDLIIGRRLRAVELPSGISNYVDLTAEMEDPRTMRTSDSYICMPILDADVPDPSVLNDAVSRLRPGTTYVHCAQGHGRTAVFALALLTSRGQIRSFDEGLEKLKAVRPRLALNRRQEAFMRKYFGEQCNRP